MLASTSAMLSLLLAAPQQPPVPDADNFREWLTYVRPAVHEQSYREVGWRNEFWPAVQEAKRLGRPILFWTMNGHPLGCT